MLGGDDGTERGGVGGRDDGRGPGDDPAEPRVETGGEPDELSEPGEFSGEAVVEDEAVESVETDELPEAPELDRPTFT